MNKVYEVVYDAEVIDSELSTKYFSLKRDLKQYKIGEQQLIQLANDIADELKSGFISKSKTIIYNCFNTVLCIKMRCKDHKIDKGKSSGYRVIILLDKQSSYAFILNIYKHKKRKDNLTEHEKQELKILANKYYKVRQEQ